MGDLYRLLLERFPYGKFIATWQTCGVSQNGSSASHELRRPVGFLKLGVFAEKTTSMPSTRDACSNQGPHVAMWQPKTKAIWAILKARLLSRPFRINCRGRRGTSQEEEPQRAVLHFLSASLFQLVRDASRLLAC